MLAEPANPQLVAGVAHELNNPLTAVMGYGELLGDEIRAGSARNQLDKLLRESHRMKRIIDNLLHFSRQGPTTGSLVDVNVAIQEVIALRECRTHNRDFEILVEAQAGLRPVSLDADHLKQILQNLLNNAVDAFHDSPLAKVVTIRALEKEGMATIEVEDTGPGFEDVRRAFNPFYTTKPVGKGTGLGLSICYGLVKKNGGDIFAENLPCGARVVVRLPFASQIPNSFLANDLTHASAFYERFRTSS